MTDRASFNAVVYDVECGPNYFTFYAIDLNSDAHWYFEISQFRNDAYAFYQFLEFLMRNRWYMVGYNCIHYDYNLIHAFMTEPVNFGPAQFYAVSQSIIKSDERFGRTVWPQDRYVAQIDLMKIHHFDNNNKRQSLKGIEVNMRADSVVESELSFEIDLTEEQINTVIVPYNMHDVKWTKNFALISLHLIEMRLKLADRIKGDVVNFNETKIGKELLAQRIGDDLCYTRVTGRREPRQTARHSGIDLRDCILPYIRLEHPEFRRIYDWMMQTRIYSTKGEVHVSAVINGFSYDIGTGGIHGSVERQRFYADDQWAIVDDDVASYYVSVIIENGLAPEHLSDAFRREFRGIRDERKLFPKGTPENQAFKLAGNGVYGDSNSEYSVFFDPQFTMTVTISGQLSLCMLAERLLTVPTLSMIQVNTDGLSYRVHRSMMWMVDQIRDEWQRVTKLELEQARYKRMLIRDVNSYIAETESGKLKLKGAYWSPRNESWCEDIMLDLRNPGPPAFHKNFSFCIIQKAAVEHMLNGTDIEEFMRSWTNPFDFTGCEKTQRGHKLFIGETPQQRVCRYYVATQGEPMKKVMPSTHPHREGQFKQARGVSDQVYAEWHRTNGNVHNPAVHTKNKSAYEPSRVMNVNVGVLAKECNHIDSFDWSTLDIPWYVREAKKLII